MMSFLETPRFPDNIAYGSSFNTVWNTSVVATGSGHEVRNRNWTRSRKSFNVGYGLRRLADLYEVIAYFEAVAGRFTGFRFKDWSDYKSGVVTAPTTNLDVAFGIGTGSDSNYQLLKTYVKGAITQSRFIYKPVIGTISVAIDGLPQNDPGDYTVNYATGVVTFTTPPGGGEVLTWGGEFDVPCRFDADILEVSMESFQSGSLNIPIVEIRVA